MSAETAAPLPEWNLSHLYPGPGSAELKADLADLGAAALAFRTAYEGRIARLTPQGFGAALAEYERIQETIGRIMSYAMLAWSADVADPAISKFLQETREQVTDLSTPLVFFALEVNRLEEDRLEALLADQVAAHYRPYIRDLRQFRDHQLSDEIERLLHDREVAGASAWMRLFDESIAGLRFQIGEERVEISEALNLLSDSDAGRRRAAALAIGQVFNDNIRLFSLITNTLAKDKQIDDRWRGYAEPTSFRHLSNAVEPEVVEALAGAVRDAYPRLSHRYYAMKARWLGGEKLDYWDRNAPLPDAADRKIAWPEAERIVLEAYHRFSPELGRIGQRFFAEGWIDARLRPGKQPGAFSHPTVPSAHPYILLNYHGRTDDVMTLAHELGHGVHQVLAAGQGHLVSQTPLTLAETASVFGEMLTFRALLDAETDPVQRKSLLAGKVEDMLNTVVRQIAFHEFEKQVHGERRAGELTAERLGEIWMGVQRDSLGPALRFDEQYRHWWAYIPHFIHSPFYVYAYAFGDCLVNALYAVYQEAEDGFAARYLDMLRAGGARRHKELLAPFGLDAADPEFWNRGLGVIEGLIDELEQVG